MNSHNLFALTNIYHQPQNESILVAAVEQFGRQFGFIPATTTGTFSRQLNQSRLNIPKNVYTFSAKTYIVRYLHYPRRPPFKKKDGGKAMTKTLCDSEEQLLSLFKNRAYTVPQLAELQGIPLKDRKGRARISDIVRRLVNKNYLAKSKHREKHAAYYYGTSYDQILETKMMDDFPPQWQQCLDWLEYTKVPYLLSDLKRQFKLEDPRWELNKQLRILEQNGKIVRGTINKWQYLRHPNSKITEEHRQALARSINYRKKMNALGGNMLERKCYELIKEKGLVATNREVETRRHYENEQGEIFEYDIIEKQWFGEVYELNIYSVKNHTASKVDVYELEDRARAFYGKAIVSRRILICTDAGKAAWDTAKRKGILILTVHRLMKLYTDDAVLQDIKKGVLEARRIARHGSAIDWREGLSKPKDLMQTVEAAAEM